MKLTKLLTELEKLSPDILDDFSRPPILYGNNLKNELIFQLIKSTDEFKDVELIIMDLPIMESMPGVNSATGLFTAKTLLLQKNTRFTGRVLLYAITTTPKMYNDYDFNTPVKNGCLISPLLYEPDNFTPFKKLILNFDPTDTANDAEVKQKLINQFKHMLDNPAEYEAKGHRGVLLRGVFGDFTFDENGGKDTF